MQIKFDNKNTLFLNNFVQYGKIVTRETIGEMNLQTVVKTFSINDFGMIIISR